MKKRKISKNKKILLSTLIIVIVLATLALVYKTATKPNEPAELIKLKKEIEAMNANKSFDLDYEYTGPNTYQPIPFNKD